jgi:hypothetical protein
METTRTLPITSLLGGTSIQSELAKSSLTALKTTLVLTTTGGETPVVTSGEVVPAFTSPPAQTKELMGVGLGLGIPCLIFGVAALFLLLRPKHARRGKHERVDSSHVVGAKQTPPHVAVQEKLPELDRFLLEATPEKELKNELASLSHLLQLHVENNYHLQPVRVNSSVLTQALASLGIGKGNDAPGADVIVALASKPKSRHVTLQFVISHVLFSSIDFHPPSQLSILPAPVVAFLENLPPEDDHGGGIEGKYILGRILQTNSFIARRSAK